MHPPTCWRGCTGPPLRPGRTGHREPMPLVEHKAVQEAGHPAQIVELTHMQHMTAGKQVQCTAIPMLPKHYGLVRWSHPVTEAGDDHPTVLGDQRLIVQWAVIGQPGG